MLREKGFIKFRSLLGHFLNAIAKKAHKRRINPLDTQLSRNDKYGILKTHLYNTNHKNNMETQYAVCHLQRGSGNDSGMSCHIERKTADGKRFIPENADKNKMHLNRELITFTDGVKNRTAAIQYRLEHANLRRKIGKNQTKAIRIILSGTHEQMIKIEQQGKLNKWIDANLQWLKENFGADNLVSCVLHMDEKTPHLHATVVPIVEEERKRREREGEKKYKTKPNGSRLCANDVMARSKLHEYQDSYGKAMKPFGLERGVVGSTAKHLSRSEFYHNQEEELQTRIESLQEEVEKLLAKSKDGKSQILSLFAMGELPKVKKENADKDQQINDLKKLITQLKQEKSTLEQQAKKQYMGYQAEIQKAIQRIEALEQKISEKDERIVKLDKVVYPQRYNLSSGATLTQHFIPNLLRQTLHIWTQVGAEKYDVVNYDVPYNLMKQFGNDEITIHELVNAVFEPWEQVNQAQADLLKATFTLASGGEAQTHVGTGGGGNSSDMPWGDKGRGRIR